MSLCDSRIERIRRGLAILSLLKVRVVDLEYSYLYKKPYSSLVCESLKMYYVMGASRLPTL